MSKRYSKKFWIVYWTLSAIFLGVWFLYWNIRSHGISQAANLAINILPIDTIAKNKYTAVVNIADYFFAKDDQERTLLILFQNNLEIRPGGGFLGAFAVAKIRGGKIVSLQTHDLSNFDGLITNTQEPPYPVGQIMGIGTWKMRDSNFSPDFSVNAQKAIDFYKLGKGQEKIDGVIGITSNVLTSILNVTGPITIDGYPGTYDANNAIIALEYQVEKAFGEQGIEREDRKSIMSELAREIEKRVIKLSVRQKLQLADVLMTNLDRKDIQLYFLSPNIQAATHKSAWDGKVDESWNQDYLMTSDANLGSFKSDYYVKRSIQYTIDLTKENPEASLKIEYSHTAKQRDWMTRDYLTYLRVYVPENAWLIDSKNFDNTKFGKEFGKKYFGSIVKVPLGTLKTVELTYDLPAGIAPNYALKIQKQAGLDNVPVSVKVILKDGTIKTFNRNLDTDLQFNPSE